MNTQTFGTIDQIGYLVDDLDQSIGRWVAHTGVGPWTVFRGVSLEGRYRGKPVTVTMDVALGYQGDTQIELIKATNDAPSPYRHADGRPVIGMHHVAWVVDDIDGAVARLTSNGLAVVFEAENPSTRVAYLAHDHEPGVLYEVIEGAGMRELIRSGIAAARSWDGSNPVTTYEAAA